MKGIGGRGGGIVCPSYIPIRIRLIGSMHVFGRLIMPIHFIPAKSQESLHIGQFSFSPSAGSRGTRARELRYAPMERAPSCTLADPSIGDWLSFNHNRCHA